MERSANEPPTCVTAVELLFVGFGSAAEGTIGVLLLGRAGVGAANCATMSKVAIVPLVSVAMEQEIAPVPPTAGLIHVNDGPVGCVSETKVVFGGSVSLMFTAVASDGPLFVTTMW